MIIIKDFYYTNAYIGRDMLNIYCKKDKLVLLTTNTNTIVIIKGEDKVKQAITDLTAIFNKDTEQKIIKIKYEFDEYIHIYFIVENTVCFKFKLEFDNVDLSYYKRSINNLYMKFVGEK